MGGELLAPTIDRTTCNPSGVASPVTTNHAAQGSVLVNLRNADNLKISPEAGFVAELVVSEQMRISS
jgi:hypothetical protein